MQKTLAALTRNPLSLLGSALVLISGILFLSLLSIELLGAEGHPYVGIITYMILPAAMVLGLVMIVWGIRRERRSSADAVFPVIDLNLEQTRKQLVMLLLLVVGGVVLLAATTFKGVEYMESTSFCGEVCHSVMQPEFTAYQRSPHARVKCVECHVGPGTSWFVKSKLNGAWQLVSTVFDLYSKPIPTPVHNLRPSKGTCEHCHWPTKFHGVLPRLITHYADDEPNTELKTVLLLKVGGYDFAENEGIHWHMDPDIRIRYRANESRETMYEVEVTYEDGSTKRFRNETTADEASDEWRVMDCVDCHNRPTHIYYSAEESVDLALKRGFIKNDLPFVRREGVTAIRGEYASEEEARKGIAAHLRGFYGDRYPELTEDRPQDIEEAARVLTAFWKSNVFPSMNIGWDTYPDHSGHEKSPGCFRCHDGDHATETGEKISWDCSLCHTVVAWNEASPEILELIRE